MGLTKDFYFSYFLNKCWKKGVVRQGWTWSKTLRMPISVWDELRHFLHYSTCICAPPLPIIIAPRLYHLLCGNVHHCSTRNIQHDGSGWNGFFLWLNGWKSSRQHRKALIWKMLSPSLGAVWPPSVHLSYYIDGEECADLTGLSKVEICRVSSFCWFCGCILLQFYLFSSSIIVSDAWPWSLLCSLM